jgi:flavorubredoxin
MRFPNNLNLLPLGPRLIKKQLTRSFPTQIMITRIDQVAHKIYRISSMIPGEFISFNQFLIDDERPTLIHTGMHPMYEAVRKAVGQVLDPARLAYVVVPHFESDECGGMGRFVQGSPDAVLACSETGVMINLGTWDYAGPVKGYRDGDVIDLGEKKLRFLETPHVHHWDSAMVYEETTGSLFPADLFIQPGEQPPVVRENRGRDVRPLSGGGNFCGQGAGDQRGRPARETRSAVDPSDARRQSPC